MECGSVVIPVHLVDVNHRTPLIADPLTATMTIWTVITDIRSERMARYCGMYAACLCCFFYWNYNVAVNVGIKYIDGVYTLVGFQENRVFYSVMRCLASAHSSPAPSSGGKVLLVYPLGRRGMQCGDTLLPWIHHPPVASSHHRHIIIRPYPHAVHLLLVDQSRQWIRRPLCHVHWSHWATVWRARTGCAACSKLLLCHHRW